MSIPSDPLQPHSISNVPQQITPGGSSPQVPMSKIDPTGVWTRFLSTSGSPATPEDVRMFIQGLLKTFSIIIQQQQKAAARANERLKKVIEGEE